MPTFKLAMLIALAAMLAIPVTASADSPRDRATGGGQINVTTGAGDTVAFSAQEDGRGGVKGQIQVQDREGGTGKGHTTHHVAVDCLVVTVKTAYISGTNDAGQFIGLYVVDGGEGKDAADIVSVFYVPEPTGEDGEENPCEVDEGETALTRGNVQVHDANPAQSLAALAGL